MPNSLVANSLNDLVCFDPFREMEDFLQDYMALPRLRMTDVAPRMRADLSETEQAYRLKAEVPDVQKEDITVSIDGNRVSISTDVKKKDRQDGGKLVRSERYGGQQYRSFTLPKEVDESKAEAKCQDGIPELILPKKPGSGKRTSKIQ